MNESADILVFAAHPDDAELAAGGLLARCVKLGHRVGIVDLTRGELGTRGTAEIRAAESAAADDVLGISFRRNLGMPDGHLEESIENRKAVVEAIRRHRPRLVLAPWTEDLHPDHAVAGRLVAAAFYPSGFAKLETDSPAYRPAGLLHYMFHFPFTPSFVLDVTDVYETRMAAVRCYASQLHDPNSKEPTTNISAPGFLEKMTARYRYYGAQIGVEFGEPYWSARPLALLDPLTALGAAGGPA